MKDLKSHFHIERLDEAVNDAFEDAEAFLKANGVFDQDSFVELTNE